MTAQTLQGKFITFEGTEGVGKTTQIGLLQKYLQSKDIETLVTHEPGGTETGESIRKILKDPNATNINPYTELLLMFAARAQHLREVIYPALRTKTWVLCDRFTDASYAYQGGGRKIPFARIQKIEAVTQGDFTPDLTILLVCDVETCMQRVSRRGKKDRFENEQPDFFERVQQTYAKLADDHPRRFAVIDADRPVDDVAVEIRKAVDRQFPGL